MPKVVDPAGLADAEQDAQRWAIVSARDAAAAGGFVYAVRTTGVYCRPGCASRRPRRENVAFFDSPALARQAGYRACRRCRPDAAAPVDPAAATVARVCALLAAGETPPRLDELAQAVGLSPAYLHRLFKQTTGVTPRAYAAALRAGRVQAELRQGAGVTDALYTAGYGASSRFYAEAPATLGMQPGEYRRGGSGVAIQAAVVPCRLGWLLVAATARGVCTMELGDTPGELEALLRSRFPSAQYPAEDPAFAAWVEQAVACVDASGQAAALPLDIQGTAFQRRVWEALRAIPPGATRSYAEVAQALGSPRAVRAVAGACAANQLAVAVPCHRVVRSDGGLSGYRWGPERKRKLLEQEAETVAGQT